LHYHGVAALNISGLTISGSASGDFQQTNNCGSSLRPGATCTISITFSPQDAGIRNATLQVADSARNSPQTISLSGTGIGLGLTVGPNGSASATVSAGQTASYTLAIGGAGTSGTATFICSGAPSGAICTVPANQAFSANTPTTFTVSGSAAAPQAGALRRQGSEAWMWVTFLLVGIVLLSRPIGSDGCHKRKIGYLSMLLSVILLLPSCGGGTGSTTRPTGGTPSGTYKLVLTASSGTNSQSMSLTLTIR